MKSRLDKVLFRILGKDVTFPPENYKLPAFVKVISKIFSYVFTIALLLLGAVGLVSAYLNPFTYLLPYVDNCYSYLGVTACGAETSLIQLETLSTTLYHNMLYTLVGSIAMLTIGLLQPEARRTYFSLPRKIMQTYRAMVTGRDWLIAKIEYLNSESGKWKTTFNVMKSPYSLLTKMGFSPQMAISFLAVGGVATTSVAVNETVFAEKSFFRGDSGLYSAPSDVPLPLTYKDLPNQLEQALLEENTLAISLGAVPVREIILHDISIGEVYKGGSGNGAGATSVIPSVCDATDPAKSGNAKCPAILVSGIPAIAASGDTPAQVATRIRIGEMTVETSRCKEMHFRNSDVHTLTANYNIADGLSIYQEAGDAPRRTQLSGSNSSDSMVTNGGTFDRLLISAGTSGVNGTIGKLELKNIFSKGGLCLFKDLDIGVLNILENEVGHDSNLATKEFKIYDVTARSWSLTDNIELNLSEPPTQEANP